MKAFLVQALNELHATLLADTNNADMQRVIRKLSVAYTEFRGAVIPQLPIELAVIEYCGERNERRESGIEKREKETEQPSETPTDTFVSGSLTLDHLTNHWTDVIAELKPYNHSVAGVMRSTRPAAVKDGIVTIEAFYTFHKDKLSETKTRETIATVLGKLFGEKVRVEVVLGKK